MRITLNSNCETGATNETANRPLVTSVTIDSDECHSEVGMRGTPSCDMASENLGVTPNESCGGEGTLDGQMRESDSRDRSGQALGCGGT
jgi:hypothetical protein